MRRETPAFVADLKARQRVYRKTKVVRPISKPKFPARGVAARTSGPRLSAAILNCRQTMRQYRPKHRDLREVVHPSPRPKSLVPGVAAFTRGYQLVLCAVWLAKEDARFISKSSRPAAVLDQQSISRRFDIVSQIR